LEAHYFKVLWWFLPYIDINQPWVYMCPTLLNTPSTSLPNPIPLGCPRAPALSALLHASNLHWSSILHMVIYMFQCYSLISSHPCLLPHSPKVCSLLLCTPMFITALFTIARTWKQPRCPSADKWIRKLWYIHTMEHI